MTHDTEVKKLNTVHKVAKLKVGDEWWISSEELHHQLQKARQDWLREEIVRLEETKLDTGVIDCGRPGGEACPGCATCGMQEQCVCETYNEALQTIIDRYHSELDQDNK